MAVPLIVSCLFIALSCLIAELVRIVINKVLADKPLPRVLCHEFVATAELCAVCFEMGIVADVYGVWTYAVLLFVLTLWWAAHWQDAAACPYVHVENYLEGTNDLSYSTLCCLAEMAGGFAIYRYVQYTWSLQLSTSHIAKSVWDCEADLHVPALQGAIVECVATMLCRLTSKMIAAVEPKFGGSIDAFIGTSMVVAALDYSGGYFNPALATSLKLNCRGNTVMEHVVVYWIGSLAGSALAWWLFQKSIFQDTLIVSLGGKQEELKQPPKLVDNKTPKPQKKDSKQKNKNELMEYYGHLIR